MTLICEMYKELVKRSEKGKIMYQNKWAKDTGQHFLKGKMQMSNKYMKINISIITTCEL